MKKLYYYYKIATLTVLELIINTWIARLLNGYSNYLFTTILSTMIVDNMDHSASDYIIHQNLILMFSLGMYQLFSCIVLLANDIIFILYKKLFVFIIIHYIVFSFRFINKLLI